MTRTRHAPARVGAFVAALALLLLAGCGEREEVVRPVDTAELSVALGGEPGGAHAPIYAAQAGDAFRELGLELTIAPSANGAAALDEVAGGQADLAVATEPELLAARERGLEVVSVAALVQGPLDAIVSAPKAGIAAPEDLRGARVGVVGGDLEAALLDRVLERAGVAADGVQLQDIGPDPVAALADRRAEAVAGATWNRDAVALRRTAGGEPGVIRVERAGVPAYDQLLLVASEQTLEDDRELIRSVIAALAVGASDLSRDAAPAVMALARANPELEPELVRAVIDTTAPLFEPPAGQPYGWQELRVREDVARFLAGAGLTGEPAPAAESLTNELLPGEGLR
jgi:putative hydroxymethylpyrimidine transport system substrate-binding protein